jgi:hypothetical protein
VRFDGWTPDHGVELAKHARDANEPAGVAAATKHGLPFSTAAG